MNSISPDVDLVNRTLADLDCRISGLHFEGEDPEPTPRSRENAVAMRSTQPLSDCRLEPTTIDEEVDALIRRAAQQPPEPSACGVRPLGPAPRP